MKTVNHKFEFLLCILRALESLWLKLGQSKITNYAKQTQYKPNFIRHSLGEGGTNPILSADLSGEALAKSEASGEAGSNPILSAILSGEALAKSEAFGEGGFKSTISWVFSIWQLRFSILNFSRGTCEKRWGTADKNVFIREKLFMGAWKTKLIFLLIVYFAGFATAIYCLAPVPETWASEGLVENQASQVGEKSFVNSALKSDEFAQSFNAGMHKCLDFGKTTAQRVGTFLKQKLDDRHQADG